MKSFLIVALLMVSTMALAQENTLELLRQDLKTQAVAIMTASLPLTEKQADLFWPIYREFNNELAKLGDKRIAVLKNFAAKYDSIDEKTADKLINESLSIANKRNGLMQKYYKKVSKAVGVITAARFVQIENQMLTLIDAHIVSQVPLVKAAKAGDEKKK